ncbi:MAG: universal stress protein [Alphaproteobacteria bacterium]|nr:universal stress protein [Alphaproteobacteria bacterium]MCB9946212.1 universal stress protein [Rhodospirillaceae bacterium]
MTIRTVLTMLEGAESDVVDLAAVSALVKMFPAHVDLLHVRRDPRSVMPMVGEGLSADLIDMVQSQVEKEEETLAARCRGIFDRWCASANLPQIDSPSAEAKASARLVDMVGDSATLVATLGKMADLVVLPAPSLEDGDLSPGAEAAIYDTGRPVLFSPRRELPSFGKRVSLFWNDTVEASRSAKAAMPFLKQAEAVQVMSALDDSVESDTVKAFAASLAWHGVNADVRLVEPGDRSSGEALIDAAWEFESDLIVMGAFSHSRLREMILGGVTRHILQVVGRPVLMAH